MASAKLWRRFIRALEVEDHRGHEAQISFTESFLSNDDLLPVPVGKRTWAAWNFVSFWVADSFNINTWMIASSMIQLGLSWWQAWICVWIGYGITAPFLVLNARPGAVFHITFPVVARASFGLWGSLWCVLNRAAMACIWYGVQASIGGDCVLVMLRAMWPSVNNILKAIVVSIAGIVFFIWCIVKARGVGPIVHQPAQIHGSQLGWAIVVSCMACVNGMITLITTNLTANSVSAGCDLTALFPRFINIRRGGYIAAIVGLCMLPWNLLKSSNNFTTYLSAYAVFLSSIAGVMLADYYVVHKGQYRVSDLYDAKKDGWYYYSYGFNIRIFPARGAAKNFEEVDLSAYATNESDAYYDHNNDMKDHVDGIQLSV
ncbi:predicted protein [Postia placenta Mad-698-R]|nr:predicted protein [Postia placenta Mad-698-R]